MCYFSTIVGQNVSRKRAQNCGGICPQEAETCKYCKFSLQVPIRSSERARFTKGRSADCRSHPCYRSGRRPPRDQYLALLTYFNRCKFLWTNYPAAPNATFESSGAPPDFGLGLELSFLDELRFGLEHAKREKRAFMMRSNAYIRLDFGWILVTRVAAERRCVQRALESF